MLQCFIEQRFQGLAGTAAKHGLNSSLQGRIDRIELPAGDLFTEQSFGWRGKGGGHEKKLSLRSGEASQQIADWLLVTLHPTFAKAPASTS